jgi:hypothetical protein
MLLRLLQSQAMRGMLRHGNHELPHILLGARLYQAENSNEPAG